MLNESIEFDLKVNGKEAKTSINDVEKAQKELDGTVEKTSKNIKVNWVAIGAAATAAAATIGVMVKKSVDLERTLFGLNKETKDWIKNTSEQYGVSQEVVGSFVQMGKAASLSGDTISSMVEQGIAMSRQFANLNVDSAVEDLTEFYSTGNASGAVLEYLEKVTGNAEIATESYSVKLKALQDNTKNVNDEFAKTKAAQMDKLMIEIDNAAIDVGSSFADLADETGIVSKAVWVAKKAMDGLSLAFNGWQQLYYEGQKLITFDDKKLDIYNKKLVELGDQAIKIRERLGGAAEVIPAKANLSIDGDETIKNLFSPNITKEWLDFAVKENEKVLAEQRKANEKLEGEQKRAADKALAEREKQMHETLAIQAQFMDDYNHTTMTAYEYELSNLDKQYELYRGHVEDKAALDEWYAEQRRRLQEEYNEQMKAYAAMGDALTDGLTDGIMSFTEKGKVNFKEMANSIIQDMIKIQIQASMMSLFGGFSGGGGGLLGGAFDMVFNAKGNAFTNGNVTPFANGGVVDSPTMFPMANGAGIMGEAGSEVIAPLKRDSSGNMGVGAVAPVVNVNVQNYGNDNVKIEQNGDNIQVIISQIAASITRGTGDVGKAIESRYGIRKA